MPCRVTTMWRGGMRPAINIRGWWDDTGGGRASALDTDRFFVVGLNDLGGCRRRPAFCRSTLKAAKYYGADFPVVTVKDWVKSQAMLADDLGHHAMGGGGGRQPRRRAGLAMDN